MNKKNKTNSEQTDVFIYSLILFLSVYIYIDVSLWLPMCVCQQLNSTDTQRNKPQKIDEARNKQLYILGWFFFSMIFRALLLHYCYLYRYRHIFIYFHTRQIHMNIHIYAHARIFIVLFVLFFSDLNFWCEFACAMLNTKKHGSHRTVREPKCGFSCTKYPNLLQFLFFV